MDTSYLFTNEKIKYQIKKYQVIEINQKISAINTMTQKQIR